jgi:hypothetical protein
MRKGAAISMPVILALVLIVIVVGVSFGTLGVAKGLVDYADSILRGTKPNIVVESYLDSIECAYRRCKDGCSPALDNLVISVGKDEKRCNTDYCVPFADSDNRVCDALARDHPVVAKIESDIEFSTASLAYAVDSCPGDEGVCAVGVTKGIDAMGDSNNNMLWRGFSWFDDAMVKRVVETSDSCGKVDNLGVVKKPVSCEAGSGVFPSDSDAICCAKSLQLENGIYYTSGYEVVNPYVGGTFKIYNQQDTVGTVSLSTSDQLACSKLSEPCIRLRPENMSITSDGSFYKVSFYMGGETNIAKSLDPQKDPSLYLYAAFGKSWNDMSATGFKKQDFAGVEMSLVPSGCGKLDGSCSATAITGPTGDALIWKHGTDLIGNTYSWLMTNRYADGATDCWGVVAFNCGGDLHASTLADNDLIITYKFEKNASFEPSKWYDLTGDTQAAFYIGGAPVPGSANIYWSPNAATANTNAKFYEKAQTLNYGGRTEKGGYCTPGGSSVLSSDALVGITTGSDVNFPGAPSPVFNWEQRCQNAGYMFSFPAENCMKCGKGCPTGLCDDTDGSCSVAWAGAVSLKFPPKSFVCCSGSKDWQEGNACPSGQTKVAESQCKPNSCAGQCTEAGYKNPVFDTCTDPVQGASGPNCKVCQCLSPG